MLLDVPFHDSQFMQKSRHTSGKVFPVIGGKQGRHHQHRLIVHATGCSEILVQSTRPCAWSQIMTTGEDSKTTSAALRCALPSACLPSPWTVNISLSCYRSARLRTRTAAHRTRCARPPARALPLRTRSRCLHRCAARAHGARRGAPLYASRLPRRALRALPCARTHCRSYAALLPRIRLPLCTLPSLLLPAAARNDIAVT